LPPPLRSSCFLSLPCSCSDLCFNMRELVPVGHWRQTKPNLACESATMASTLAALKNAATRNPCKPGVTHKCLCVMQQKLTHSKR
jgi:hypothetical protein